MISIGSYVARETAVSAIISGAISTGFFFGLFGLRQPAPVQGWGGYAMDFVPQSAPVAFMACLVPALLVRQAAKSGRIAAKVQLGAGALVGLASACAMLGALVGGGVALIWIGSGVAAVAPLPALLIKIGYGALIGALVTRQVLHRLLRLSHPIKD